MILCDLNKLIILNNNFNDNLKNNLGKIVDRVRRGFNNLKMLQPHPRVTQLLGYCIAGNITVMITELGTWGDLRQFLLTNTFKEFTMAQRTDIALQVGPSRAKKVPSRAKKSPAEQIIFFQFRSLMQLAIFTIVQGVPELTVT